MKKELKGPSLNLWPLLLYLLDSSQNKGFAVFCVILEMAYYAKLRQNNSAQKADK